MLAHIHSVVSSIKQGMQFSKIYTIAFNSIHSQQSHLVPTKMSSDSQVHSSHSDESITSENLEEMMWEEINDPTEAQLEARLEAQLEMKLMARLVGNSNQRGGYTRRYISRDHA